MRTATAAVALALPFLLGGCGGDAKKTVDDDLAGLIEKRLIGFEQPAELAGGRFTFTGWEWLPEVSAGETRHLPLKGRYVAVYFTFQGSGSAVPGPLDPALFKLRDCEGRLFSMDEGICEGPAKALAEDKGRDLPASLRWEQPGESPSFALFDVPYNTGILTVIVNVPPGRGDPDDRIELALEE